MVDGSALPHGDRFYSPAWLKFAVGWPAKRKEKSSSSMEVMEPALPSLEPARIRGDIQKEEVPFSAIERERFLKFDREGYDFECLRYNQWRKENGQEEIKSIRDPGTYLPF